MRAEFEGVIGDDWRTCHPVVARGRHTAPGAPPTCSSSSSTTSASPSSAVTARTSGRRTSTAWPSEGSA